MERDGQEMAANEVAENVEFKRKDLTFPLKPEGHILMESPITYGSQRSKWPVNDSSGFAPPCPSTSSMNETETGIIVEELTVENYKSSSKLRQSQLQRMYRVESRSECEALDENVDHVLLRAKKQLARMSYENHKSKDIDQTPGEIALHLKATDNLAISSHTLSVAATRLKTSSSRPSFSQLFVKNGLKGKGVIRRDPETCTTADNDRPCLLGVDGSNNELCTNGISLREWLKPGGRKEDKFERLLLFRQIVKLVDSAHSQGVVLQDLRPSCFYLLSSNRVMYTGLSAKKGLESAVDNDLRRKRSLEKGMNAVSCSLGAKQLKLNENMQSLGYKTEFTSHVGSRSEMENKIGSHTSIKRDSNCFPIQPPIFRYPTTSVAQSISAAIQLEERWYACPGEHNGRSLTFSANIYSLGVFLFELLCCFESMEQHSAMMLDLSQRILPPNFLSESPKEAGFCLWLLHPEPLSRPTTREILQSALFGGSQEWFCGNNLSESPNSDMAESEILLHFLTRLEEQKQKLVPKLIEEIRFLEEDIKEAERGHLLKTSSVVPQIQNKFPDAGKMHLHFEGPGTSVAHHISNMKSDVNKGWLSKNITQLEHAYFSMRSQIHSLETAAAACSDKDLLKNRDRLSELQSRNGQLRTNQKYIDPLGSFFEGLCKFACFSKFEVCGTIRNGDLLKSVNVICTLSFDRDEDYIATAGISKRIKVFEFDAFMNDSIDIHYPVVEMSNKSKISCVCWNNYIKNYLASTDYDGVVQTWDAGTGQGFCQYTEHQKRAWSVDFSQADPTKFASGSDDCSVKFWSINEKSSLGTIWSPANVCCVQFSTFSPHLLAFGSADYKVYCYDLRHARIPLCTLAAHEKAVSNVKFLDSKTLLSASTDSTLKLWDLDKTGSDALSSNTCALTFSGHKNEKNFVGLSVLDGYIACGSETNEVYCYHRSLPMPITSYKFESVDPISGHQITDENGQFVSSVCWRQKSNMLVAANSAGSIKLLKLV
ncbi:protein SUPPRESSOR OF PHYA-105 1-like [Durio zibethinus]|uniref:Protein SUPPRESSOR OF PHYA-105 1-like n=1 Tax=Durio zibethinus TaxID=66656 RepID=A0A6P5ZYC7_DURZI|nr:protein SUPPRESSOR OF PHYA-105 1-like [Durio zibethinus]